MNDIKVGRSLVIPASELTYRFSTSGGPGGQHANKASTRVELLWDIDTSEVLGPRRRARLKGRLKNRLDSEGRLRVVADTHRSQTRNREEAAHRLASLVADALRPTRPRLATQPTRAATQRRVAQKRRRGDLKRLRGPPNSASE